MYPALEAAWAKYNKAARDLGVLHANARRFYEREPYRVVVDQDEDGWHVVRVELREEPPPVFGVLVGSVAHQAYSALNHVAWELVVRNLGEEEAAKARSFVEFPICDKRREFGKRKVLGLLAPDVVDKLDELQPFHKPKESYGKIQHPLLLMKELADADKHRVLPTTYGSVDLAKSGLAWDASATDPTFQRLLAETERNLMEGSAIARIRFGTNNATANVRVVGQPKVDIVFDSDTWEGVGLLSIGDCVAAADRCISHLAPLLGVETWPASHDPHSPYEW